MISLVAVLLVARITDGIRLNWRKQDNKSVSIIEHVDREERLLEAKKVERRSQDNNPLSLVEHVQGDGKLFKEKEGGKTHEDLVTNTPPQQVMTHHRTADFRAGTLTMYAAEVGIVCSLILTCCGWCFLCFVLGPRRQSDPPVATRRGTERHKTMIGTRTDEQHLPVYFIYWDLDGDDPKRPWNPTDQGGTDGLQLAIIKDGEVRRIPTDGICTQHGSAMHKSKEWQHLNAKTVQLVNYTFDAIPSAVTANEYKEQYGVKELELRRSD